MAGVSIGTVDRALNDRKGVNKEVAQRIKEIAASVGYTPNKVAKGLVARRKEIKLGVIIHTPKHPFIEELMRGIESAKGEFKDYGVEIIVKYGKGFDAEDQMKLIDELIDEGIKGLAIIPIHDKKIIDKINEIHKNGIAVALMVSDENADCLAYVGCDLRRGGAIIGGLAGMMSNGRANVLYATSPLGTLGNIDRLEGFKEILASRYPDIKLAGVSEFPNDDLMSYKKALTEFEKYDQIDTLVIATGFSHGLLEAFTEAYADKKIRIIALDLAPSIIEGMRKDVIQASVVQHPYEQGKKVIKLLFDYLVMGKKPEGPKKYIETDIVIYESIF